jgi:cobalt-zinc-cadmium efflux system outer membrane protein
VNRRALTIVRVLATLGAPAVLAVSALAAPRVASAQPAAAGPETAAAHPDLRLTGIEALKRVRAGAPELRVSRDRQGIARAEIGVAGVLPNPVIIAGTSTQAAKLSLGASLALPILGQRGATIAASRAESDTVRVEGEITWTEVRAGAARAYVQLWLAQERAVARREGALIAARIDDAVAARVELGAAPEVDGLRTRAERLRSEADAREADELVDAAASQLGFYLGSADAVRADGEYAVPADAPALPALASRIDTTPLVRRETSDARAADARVDREKALARPTPVVELGTDIGDPTLPANNYRATIAIDVPLLSMRGAQIDRERAVAAAARSRASVEVARGRAGLTSAYHTFVAADARAKTLRTGVLVAAEAAARATEESYALGRAQLVAVLDASRTRLDTRLTLAEAIATRAQAWIEIEHLLGTP